MKLKITMLLIAGILLGVLLLACDEESSDGYIDYRIECVDNINAYRATLDLPPYERWKEAELCSDDEAKKDSESGVFHGAFGQCGEGAQNECPGWNSIESVLGGCLQSMWDEGPGEPFSEHGHFINMSSESYSKVACGFYETSDGGVWSVQNFK